MERVYWNDEWNQKPTETQRLVIWDFTEEGIKEYTLEEYYKLEINKNKYKHVNKHTK